MWLGLRGRWRRRERLTDSGNLRLDWGRRTPLLSLPAFLRTELSRTRGRRSRTELSRTVRTTLEDGAHEEVAGGARRRRSTELSRMVRTALARTAANAGGVRGRGSRGRMSGASCAEEPDPGVGDAEDTGPGRRGG